MGDLGKGAAGGEGMGTQQRQGSGYRQLQAFAEQAGGLVHLGARQAGAHVPRAAYGTGDVVGALAGGPSGGAGATGAV